MKKFICMVVSLVLVFALFGTVHACSTISGDGAIRPCMMFADLYDNEYFSGHGSADTTEFTATTGSGNTIRVWYENHANSAVTVRLYKYGWFGLKDVVLEFAVKGNSAEYKEYTASGADSGKYYINVDSDDGGLISGYLRARQL